MFGFFVQKRELLYLYKKIKKNYNMWYKFDFYVV